MIKLINKTINSCQKYGLINIIKYLFLLTIKKIKINKLRKNNRSKKYPQDYKTDMNFFFDLSKKKIVLNYYSKYKEKKNQIIEDANRIIQHKFDLLGSGEVCLGEAINWQQDFKSGFIWPNIFYTDIKIIDLDKNIDVKVPWELSRFQHLFTLGKAFWLTSDLKYYKECKSQIEHWIKNNKINIGINWCCAMDVAIRAVNWIFFYFQFSEEIQKDEKFLNKFNYSLYEHGEYIFLNLEKNLKLANNHYLSNLCGLMFIGLYFKKLKKRKAKIWINYSKKELEKEIFIQTNEDGTSYESSTSYHRLVTELLFYSMAVAEKNKVIFSEEYNKRLEKMFEFLAKITKSNGKIPMIGDVDNGRLLILDNYKMWDVQDVREIIALGGEYYNNKILKNIGGKEIENKMWIFGSLEEYEQKYLDVSVAFPQGGYYILRNSDIYCMIRCGELSCRGEGGHSHNDQLSVEVNIKGEDFIVDTGTGVYTENYKIRNLFRSTRQHNTVYLENYEQNFFEEKNLFYMKERTFSKCIEFTENEFIGEHYGYLTQLGIIHRRKIILKKENIEIIDEIGNIRSKQNFIFSPNTIINNKENKIIVQKNNIKLLIQGEINGYKIGLKKYSYKYGDIQRASSLEIPLYRIGGLVLHVV